MDNGTESIPESATRSVIEAQANRNPQHIYLDQPNDSELSQDAQKQQKPLDFDDSFHADRIGTIDDPITLQEPDFEAIGQPLDLDAALIDYYFDQATSQGDPLFQEELIVADDASLPTQLVRDSPTAQQSHEMDLDSQESAVPATPQVSEAELVRSQSRISTSPIAQQVHGVATNVPKPARGSTSTLIEVMDISDDEEEQDGTQVALASIPTPPGSIKREDSVDLLQSTNNDDTGIAQTIEIDQSHDLAAQGSETQAAKAGQNDLAGQHDRPIFLDSDDEELYRLPSLALARIEEDREQEDSMDAGRTLTEKELINMLDEYTKNNTTAFAEPKIEEDVTRIDLTQVDPAQVDLTEVDLTRLDDVDSEAEDLHASNAFAQLKADHEAKLASGNLAPGDVVRFRTAVQAEKKRQRRRKGKQALQDAEEQEEHSLFFPEQQPQPLSTSTSPGLDQDSDDDFIILDPDQSASARGRKRAHGHVEDLSGNDKASEDENSRGTQTKRARKRTVKSPSHVCTAATAASSSRGRGSRGGRRGGSRGGRGRGGKRGKDLYDMTNLLPYDMVDQTARNREQGDQPQLGAHSRRENALADLIASLPDDQRDLHIGDKKILHDAVKSFTSSRTIKAHDGKWKLKGMNSSLHHYQTIGAAKMRDRENEGKPAGGLLGDDMGLGKTVMAIATIIDGRPTTEFQNRTKATLIVAPAALLQQWYNEVLKHADRNVGFIKNVLIWKSSAMQPSDPVALLNNFDVVITSYHELLRSFPKKKFPPELVTARAKEEWWEKYFEENKGVLYQVKWHRIILDEAQAIKNHLSRTSEAAWCLRGRYRWTLSGTPVVNSLEEFFAYFRFLKLWITGDFETWKKNFCKRGSAKALVRLREMLGKIMIRRTHKDKLFGNPIIQLPPLKFDTIHLEFSTVERALYKIVRDRFLHTIRSFGGGGNLSANYSNIFVLLLRLRQLTAHILLVQKTIKDLLHQEDLEKLWKLTESEEVQSNATNLAHAEIVRAALLAVEQEKAEQQSAAGTPGPASVSSGTAAQVGLPADAGLSAHFHNCLESMRKSGEWEAAHQRSLCPRCGHPPKNPHVTSCLHIYCFACLNELAYEGLLEEDQAATCLECNAKFRKAESYAAQSYTERAAPRSQRATTSRRSKDRDVEENVDWFRLSGPILQSTKTAAAVKQVETWLNESPENKILLFSQWRGMLKVFSRICSERKWCHEQFHGEMSFDARNKAVEKFTNQANCRILLAAMKAGGVGLNLTAANRVILVDLWWNVAMEQQAYCRVFRIGQVRDVEVVRFSINSTVDAEMLKMQERKTKEIDSAMEKKSGAGGKLSTEELMQLFGVGGTGEEGEEGGEEGFILPDDPYMPHDSDMEDNVGGVEGLL